MKNLSLAALSGVLLLGAASGALAQSATYFPDRPSKSTEIVPQYRAYDFAPTGSINAPRGRAFRAPAYENNEVDQNYSDYAPANGIGH
jgi:hypothetical protein